MTRLHKSVYFEVCLYNWDKNAHCPDAELALMLSDLSDGMVIVEQLIAAGKLHRDCDGVWSERAMIEAQWAYDQWKKRSTGGQKFRPSQGKSKSVGKTLRKSVRKSRPTLIVSNNQNQNQNHS